MIKLMLSPSQIIILCTWKLKSIRPNVNVIKLLLLLICIYTALYGGGGGWVLLGGCHRPNTLPEAIFTISSQKNSWIVHGCWVPCKAEQGLGERRGRWVFLLPPPPPYPALQITSVTISKQRPRSTPAPVLYPTSCPLTSCLSAAATHTFMHTSGEKSGDSVKARLKHRLWVVVDEKVPAFLRTTKTSQILKEIESRDIILF